MSKLKFKDAKDFEFVFRNNGMNPDGDASPEARVHMKDALAFPDSTEWFTVTVENYVREAVEPVLIGANLLQRINYKSGTVISLPSVGAITAADIPEGAEYPEKTLNFGSGVQITTIGKSGVAIKVTEECVRYSQYDVLGLNLRAAGRALARHKEAKIWAMLTGTGVVTHDNVTPASSVHGACTGRDLDGGGNGACTMDDILQAYGSVLMNGFTPNALIVHPLTYTMWLIDPVMRNIALAGGGAWFNYWTGSGQNMYPWNRGVMGGMGPGSTELALSKKAAAITPGEFDISAAPKLPDYLGLPLAVIVSPFIPYNNVTKLTDIYVADVNNMGALIVDEEPTTDSITDALRDIYKLKIRERYSIAPLNEGNAVGVIKNVKVTPNRLLNPTQGMGKEITAILDQSSAVLDAAGDQV
jgi:hypothetical protein